MRNVTELNSKEMKTFVETFVVEETAELIYDNEKLDQWNEYVAMLGLKGQEKIVMKDKSPIPFMPLKSSMVNVFEVLCNRKESVENYNVSPIPVEILSLVSLSKKEGYFEKIEIWYDEKAPDPVCIGITGYWYQPTWGSDRNKELDNCRFKTKQECKDAGATSTYFEETGKYILGKWADVKHSFDQLKAMAVKRFTAERTNELKKQLKDVQRRIEDIETEVFDKFN
jgi:hypothetical protein